ncbi:MAG: aconitase family protein [Candidatus Heimdallarchaeaceae archaeon]
MISKEDLMNVLENYKNKALKRWNEYHLLPRPLTENEVETFALGLTLEEIANEKFKILEEEALPDLLKRLIANEVQRGTFPASIKKAELMYKYCMEELQSIYLSKTEALEILGNMKGGAATQWLVKLLENKELAMRTAEILKDTVLVNYPEFQELVKLAKDGNNFAIDVLKYWAEKRWEEKWHFPEEWKGIVVKVGDGISTDHLSPGKRASSRTDQPLHALYVMEGKAEDPDLLERINKLKDKAENVILVAGERLGEGSSRKSATYTVLQLIGKPVKGEPEKKEGGLVIAKTIAPIFQESIIASGIIPITMNTDVFKEGDIITVRLLEGKVYRNGEEIGTFEPPAKFVQEKIRAGGMNNYASAKNLWRWARKAAKELGIDFEDKPVIIPEELKNRRIPQNLAEKLVAMNRLDGIKTIVPGEVAEVRFRVAFSQDTTGPMTFDEYQSMAGGQFGAETVVQSLCHTPEAPTIEERDRQKYLFRITKKFGGTAFEGGEGIIHSLGNRFVAPFDVVTGGDSHTRTPRGISFPAGSDIVAAAMKLGALEMTMPEVVKVTFTGKLQKGITARDVVSALVIYAEKQGYGKGIYNGKIIEFDGVEDFTDDERYILTNATAERSAIAGVIGPDKVTEEQVKRDLEYLKNRLIYDDTPSTRNAIKALEEWLALPDDEKFLRPDPDAKYAAEITVPLDEITEPLVAKPHHPDNVATLSEVAGTKVDEVYIGSCVGGNIASIRAAALLARGFRKHADVNFVIGPATADIVAQLSKEGYIQDLVNAGAVFILPSCGLCMGNKRRIGSGSTAFTTTTRNFRGRVGPADSQTYLGSAEIATLTALLGEIPDLETYMKLYEERVAPYLDKVREPLEYPKTPKPFR